VRRGGAHARTRAARRQQRRAHWGAWGRVAGFVRARLGRGEGAFGTQRHGAQRARTRPNAPALALAPGLSAALRLPRPAHGWWGMPTRCGGTPVREAAFALAAHVNGQPERAVRRACCASAFVSAAKCSADSAPLGASGAAAASDMSCDVRAEKRARGRSRRRVRRVEAAARGGGANRRRAGTPCAAANSAEVPARRRGARWAGVRERARQWRGSAAPRRCGCQSRLSSHARLAGSPRSVHGRRGGAATTQRLAVRVAARWVEFCPRSPAARSLPARHAPLDGMHDTPCCPLVATRACANACWRRAKCRARLQTKDLEIRYSVPRHA
jgi:hypothetical protein